jgi:hypothetical protein
VYQWSGALFSTPLFFYPVSGCRKIFGKFAEIMINVKPVISYCGKDRVRCPEKLKNKKQNDG